MSIHAQANARPATADELAIVKASSQYHEMHDGSTAVALHLGGSH